MKAFTIIKTDRLEKNLTLRKFAKAIDINASFYSKIERGVEKCPSGILELVMKELKYSKTKKAYIRLLLKANNAGITLFGGAQDLKGVPAFICTTDGKPPTKEQVMKILEQFPDFNGGKLILLKNTNPNSSEGW